VPCGQVLGKVDAERYDSADFPSRGALMSVVGNPILAPRCRFRAHSARPAWEGEVHFIFWHMSLTDEATLERQEFIKGARTK
jgi:hypothetical protein